MKLSCKYPKVSIDLKNDVYVFYDASATGKTYLLSLLKKMSVVDNVIGFTYTDSIENDISMEKCVGRTVIMFDRYDMYKGKYDNMIKELGKSAIVLIDCKDISGLDIDLKDCMIKLEDSRIEVYE